MALQPTDRLACECTAVGSTDKLQRRYPAHVHTEWLRYVGFCLRVVLLTGHGLSNTDSEA